jgi:Transposase DDE domain group 1
MCAKRLYFRADAGFANPEVYEYLEAERIKYAIRLPANRVLQERIVYLLKRPIGRPSNDVRGSYANFIYQAGSWTKRVVAKAEWHPGELYPRVGFIVTNMARPAENVVAFYNKRGTCEQWIREGKGAIRWTRLSCRSFAANAVRLQLHALAYNLGNILRTLATPEPIKDWSLTSLKEKQNRREGRQPRPLRRVPDGGGRDSEKALRRHPAVDRGTASTAAHLDSVKRSVVMRPIKPHGKAVSR